MASLTSGVATPVSSRPRPNRGDRRHAAPLPKNLSPRTRSLAMAQCDLGPSLKSCPQLPGCFERVFAAEETQTSSSPCSQLSCPFEKLCRELIAVAICGEPVSTPAARIAGRHGTTAPYWRAPQALSGSSWQVVYDFVRRCRRSPTPSRCRKKAHAEDKVLSVRHELSWVRILLYLLQCEKGTNADLDFFWASPMSTIGQRHRMPSPLQ